MRVGPKSVLIAWNGAAFDTERKILYFMGGGHTDYGGNEVYSFNLKKGQWQRLTYPSPLDHLYTFPSKRKDETKVRYCWVPDVKTVPGAPHTYDGIQFSRLTKTFFLAVRGAANGACFTPSEKKKNEYVPLLIGDIGNTFGIYEFNPSVSKVNNGLQPLHWRRHEMPFKPGSFSRTVELPDGSMLLSSKYLLFEFEGLNS